MSLSERDKKLLKILLVVIVACVPFMLFVRPLMNKCTTLGVEVAGLESEKKYMQQLALGEQTYLAEAEKAVVETQKLMAKFPSELLQEADLLFINEVEKKIPISLYQCVFGEDVAAQVTSEADQAQIDAIEAETGDITDDAVIEDNTRTTKVSDTLMGISNSTQFSYDVKYEELKEFLKYIKEHDERMVITQFTASYAGEMDIVNGNFVMVQYGLKGEGRPPVTYKNPDIMLGSNNIFMQAAGVFEEPEEEETVSDFFLMLNQPDADEDALIWGQTKDVTEQTYFTSDKNAKQEVTIEFTGEAGEYTANYYIGDESFSDEGIAFSADGKIEFEVLSCIRADEEDEVEVSLNVVNETDVVLYMAIVNDDEENPRVTVKEKTGDIFTR